MNSENISTESYMNAARQFCEKSAKIGDGWRLHENKTETHKSYIKKDMFLKLEEGAGSLLKAEYVIFYNLSYGVPSFSFNVWNSSGMLLSLEEIRQMSLIK